MRTQILDGQAALESLLARGMRDWEARQVLEVARTYKINSVPMQGGYSTMTITWENGRFVFGDFRLPS